MILDSGIMYIGEWSISDTPMRHGRGTEIFQDGTRIDAYFINDKATGFGRVIHTDGDVYAG